jgi:hypothetical protein
MLISAKRMVGPLVLMLGALGASFVISYSLRSQSSVPHSRAFVAWGFVKRFAAKGDEGPSKDSQTIFARKGDGSWADIITAQSPSGETGELRTFWDAASGRQVTLEPVTKSAMTYFLTATEMRTKIENSESCPVGVESPTARHERILGYDAVNVTEEGPAPRLSKMLVEAWVVRELGCYALRRSEVWTDGPHNQFETTRVSEMQPPAWMFEVPPDYVERSPSQLSNEWAAKFGQGFLGDSALATMEKKYDAHRPSHP